ncbi:hypothetical protein ANO11243_069170 [Dothideomycetidae sp. 11243]|nr:hypothetical protein ANO11243_069170 [fungal sp. No.11243]
MRDANTYRIHLESDVQRSEPPEFIDPDLEGYCYDPKYYCAWAVEPALREKLPQKLLGVIDDWSYAAAAVQTSLARIAILDHRGLDRGWPEKTSAHLSRTTSGANSIGSPSPPSSATSPPGGSFSIHGDAARSKLTPLLIGSTARPTYTSTAIDTPPWTPQDIKSANLAIESPTEGHLIDPLKLNERLITFEQVHTPVSMPNLSPSLSPVDSLGPLFDEPAWERYMEEYRREIDGLQKEDWPRFRHLGHKIMVDYRLILDEYPEEINQDTQKLFMPWWNKMTGRLKKVQEDVEGVSMPTLSEIKHVRRVYGLRA